MSSPSERKRLIKMLNKRDSKRKLKRLRESLLVATWVNAEPTEVLIEVKLRKIKKRRNSLSMITREVLKST
jgi:hypothetical protein